MKNINYICTPVSNSDYSNLIIFQFNVLISYEKLYVIPVFNEDNRLISLIDQIKSYKYDKFNLTYIFINNGSTDESLKIIKQSKIRYLNLKSNKGVGYALMIGYLYAKNIILNIIQLGNGKMKPSQIEMFMDNLIEENYNFVSGSRFLGGSSKKK